MSQSVRGLDIKVQQVSGVSRAWPLVAVDGFFSGERAARGRARAEASTFQTVRMRVPGSHQPQGEVPNGVESHPTDALLPADLKQPRAGARDRSSRPRYHPRCAVAGVTFSLSAAWRKLNPPSIAGHNASRPAGPSFALPWICIRVLLKVVSPRRPTALDETRMHPQPFTACVATSARRPGALVACRNTGRAPQG